MSMDVYTDIEFEEGFSPTEVIRNLVVSGWTLFHQGKAYYLPVGDDDMFDWQSEALSEKELFSILSEKEKKGEVIGVGLRFGNLEHGATVTFDHNKRTIFFNWFATKKFEKPSDFDWFIERISSTFGEYKLKKPLISTVFDSGGSMIFKREDICPKQP